MADFEIVPGVGDTLAVGKTLKPVSQVVTSGSMLDPSGNGVSPLQGKTAYDHSQVSSGNPHGTTAAMVGADATGTAAAAIAAHVAAPDPHAQYLTATEAGALYDVLGAGNAAVAAHVALSDPHAQYQKESEKGAASGYCPLDGSGLISSTYLPPIAISDFLGVAADQAAMLLLVGEKGDWCVRSDESKTYIIIAGTGSVITDWQVVYTPAAPVLSVNTKTGAVSLTYTDVGAAAASHAHAGSDITSGTLDGDRLPALSATKKGGVPATGTPSGLFLRDDGTWATSGADLSAAVILAPAASTRNVVQPTAATYVPLTIKGYAAQSANLLEWQNSTGAALAAMTAAGNLGIGRATAPYALSVQGLAACDSPVLGTEFLAATTWTSTGWTGSWAGGWTHTVGNTNALVFTGYVGDTSSLKVAYTVTGRTAGTFNMSIGGCSVLSRYVSGVWGPITLSTGNFTVMPSSDFDGTIVFSIKTITGDSTPIGALYDSAGVVAAEFRTTNGLGANTFFGIGAGARNVGIGNTAIGYQAGGRHTGGNKNALIGAYCGYSMGAGWGNVVIGYEALYQGNNVVNCIALGYGALIKAVSSVSNIGIGFNALYNSTGSYNIAIGQSAFQQLTTGGQNLAIGGYSTGYSVTTGSDNIFIGTEANLSSSTQRSRAMAIGHKAMVDQDDACVIGQTGASAPLLGLNTTTPGAQGHFVCRSATTIGMIVQGASAQTANLHEWRDSASAVLAKVDAAGNVGLGNVTVGTSGTKTLMVGTGTAPSSSPADAFQVYSADQAAGNAAPHFRTEAGDVVKLYKQAHIADPSGGSTTDAEARTAINSILVALENLGLLATS